jgi:hypothetical protein
MKSLNIILKTFIVFFILSFSLSNCSLPEVEKKSQPQSLLIDSTPLKDTAHYYRVSMESHYYDAYGNIKELFNKKASNVSTDIIVHQPLTTDNANQDISILEQQWEFIWHTDQSSYFSQYGGYFTIKNNYPYFQDGYSYD